MQKMICGWPDDYKRSETLGEDVSSSPVEVTMSLHHSLHRAASSVKRRTTASIKSVLSSEKLSLLSRSSRKRRILSRSVRNGDPIKFEVRQIPRAEISTSSTNKHDERSFENGNSRANGNSVVQEDDLLDYSTEEEGYVTANDDDMEFEDRDSSDTYECERRTEHLHLPEAFRGIRGNGSPNQAIKPADSLTENVSHPNREKLKELRIRITDSEERASKVDDQTLMRFLIARNMDVSKAFDMFMKDWKWRDQFASQGYITEDGISRQLEAEKAFLQGVDSRGRPLMVIMGSKHFSRGRDMEEFKRFCFYCIEKVIASIPEGKGKFVTIFDLGGTGFRNLDTGAAIMIADFLQSHYPERMAQLFAIHVPPMFSTAYKLVEPVIDLRSRQKIVFVNDSDMESLLRQEIGEECLPKVYGGKAELIPIQYAVIDKGVFPSKARSLQ